MSLALSGDGSLAGVTAIGDVSSTELGYLDGVTSAIQSQIDTAGGLVHLHTESFSAVSSVSVDNVFSAEYGAYAVNCDISSLTADGEIRFRWRQSGTDKTTSTYFMGGQYVSSTGTSAAYAVNAATNYPISNGDSANPMWNAFTLDIFNPYESRPTRGSFQASMTTGGGLWCGIAASVLQTDSTSFDGFTLYPQSGTITGTLRIYGYRNS